MASSARAAPAFVGEEMPFTPFGTWRENDGRLAVEYSRSVAEEIRAAVVRAAFGIGRGGTEIGGLLFGTRLGAFARIDAWLEIPCRHRLGLAFLLDDTDQETLEHLCEERRSCSELKERQLLGWFVAHSRGELMMSGDDLRLAGKYFRDPNQFCLVFRPGRFGDLEGVFYRRDEQGRFLAGSPSLCIEPHPALLALSSTSRPVPQNPQVEPPAPFPPVQAIPRGDWWTTAALAMVLTAGVAGSGWLTWRNWRALAAVPPPVSLLSLDARPLGRDLLVSWDPRSERLAPGARAFLAVHSRDCSSAASLTRAELQSGSYTVPDATEAEQASLILTINGEPVYTEHAQLASSARVRSSRP